MTHSGNASLAAYLGIEVLESDPEKVTAQMPVTDAHCQVIGYLSGGASLALAETAAGYGSLKLCGSGEFPFGIQVSGNHLRPVKAGHTVVAHGTLLRQGKSIHVWNINISDENGTLISTARVVNYIGKKD